MHRHHLLQLSIADYLQDASARAQHVQSLQTHLKETSLATLTELALLATLAACCCSQQSSSSKLTSGSILTALLQIHINGLAIVPQQYKDARDRIALAVYPIASLMNHACQPNVALCFDGSILTARAIVPIKAGSPILHCYGPQNGALVTPLRRQQLREQYHFVCLCQACQAGFDKSEQEMVGLRCLDRSCDGVMVPMQAVAAGLCSTSALPSGIGNDCCNRSVTLCIEVDRTQLKLLTVYVTAAHPASCSESCVHQTLTACIALLPSLSKTSPG